MTRVHAGSAILAMALFAAAGCGRRTTMRLPAPPQTPARIGVTETGIASWYGVPYDGRAASSGEIYDMTQLTAAHRTLPFGTWVEVTDLDNGRSVKVRINDRGPFVGGRVIDLSRAAALEIGMVGPGTARVRLKVIAPPEGLAGRVFIAETPIDDPGDDRKNVAALWDLAGLKDVAPPAEKGFSMLTASLKKKMDVQRAVDKRNAAALARREAEEVRKKSEERSLHFAGRLLRRSEAEKQMRRPAPVGMTGVAGCGKGAKVAAVLRAVFVLRRCCLRIVF